MPRAAGTPVTTANAGITDPGGAREGLVFFAGVRVLCAGGRHLVDPQNWRRLRLLLEPLEDVTLVAVETRVGGDDWLALPGRVRVHLAHPDFHPRGTTGTCRRKLLFAAAVPLVVLRCRRLVARAQAVGVVWLLEPTFFAGLLLALARRLPLYAVVIGSPADAFALKAAQRGLLVRWAYVVASVLAAAVDRLVARRADLLLVTGMRLTQRLGRGTPFSTSTVAASAIVAPAASDAVEQPVIWVHVGGVSVNKGVDTFLQALALARRSGEDHRALLIGQEDPRFPLAALVRKLELDGCVEATGRLPWEEVLDRMREGDVFVFLSRHEGMPKAPLEAMARGLPVVVAPTGAEQYVVDGRNGLVVPVDDPEACASAVRRLVGDAALRRRLIVEANSTARSHTYEASLRTIAGVLRQAFPGLTGTAAGEWEADVPAGARGA